MAMNYNQANQPFEGRDKALVPVAASTPALREPYGQLGYPIGIGEAPAEPTTLHLLLECWRILLKRKWLILGIALAFLVIGAVRTLMQTPLYTATVRLQIDASGAKVVESGNVAPEDSGAGVYAHPIRALTQSHNGRAGGLSPEAWQG